MLKNSYTARFFKNKNKKTTTTLNKQKEKKKNTRLHYIWVVMLHIQVVCFERIATWKGCYDMQKVCENISEGCNVQQKLNVKHICLVKTYGYTMIFILVYAKVSEC